MPSKGSMRSLLDSRSVHQLLHQGSALAVGLCIVLLLTAVCQQKTLTWCRVPGVLMLRLVEGICLMGFWYFVMGASA